MLGGSLAVLLVIEKWQLCLILDFPFEKTK
jgi:hypothetical protein